MTHMTFEGNYWLREPWKDGFYAIILDDDSERRELQVSMEEWCRWHDATYPVDLTMDCTCDGCEGLTQTPVMPEHDTRVSAAPEQ